MKTTPAWRCHRYAGESSAAVFWLVTVAFVIFASAGAAGAFDDSTERQSRIPAELETLRFRSVFSLTGGPAAYAVGEFTLRGPIVSTLRSLPYLSSGPVVFDHEDRIFVGPYRMDRNFAERV